MATKTIYAACVVETTDPDRFKVYSPTGAYVLVDRTRTPADLATRFDAALKGPAAVTATGEWRTTIAPLWLTYAEMATLKTASLAVFTPYAALTAAERARIEADEDRREAYKAAMYDGDEEDLNPYWDITAERRSALGLEH